MGLKKAEKQVLFWLSKKREVRVSLVKRSGIILSHFGEGIKKSEIQRTTKMSYTSIYKWLNRWEDHSEKRSSWLSWYESGEITDKEYRQLLLSIFEDEQRPGKPRTFDEKAIEKIVALAATDPESLGLPFSRWSEVLLQKELIQRKIVKTISTSQIGRILKKSSHKAAP